jgi:hypothetical protein
MEVDTTFINNEQDTHSQVSVRIHSIRQEKPRSTKEKMDRIKTITMEEPEMAYTLSLLLLLVLKYTPYWSERLQEQYSNFIQTSYLNPTKI